MQITSHASSPVCARVGADGSVTFLVPEYYLRRGRRSRRQVIETGENGERVSETLTRAIDDEISRTPGSATMELLDETPFFVKLTKDERHPGGTHAKFFFFIKVDGVIRDQKKFDGDEELGPMVNIDAEALIMAMETEGTVPLHLDATKAALAVLMSRDEAVYHRYSRLYRRCELPPALTDEEWETIHSYDKWF